MTEPTTEERLAALEEVLVGKLPLGKLPLKALQERMLSDWDPAGKELLLKGSVTRDVLAIGFVPFTLSFVAATTAQATVAHGRGKTPGTAGVLLSRAVDTDNVVVSLMQYQAADETNVYVRGIIGAAATFDAPCNLWVIA